MGSLSSSGTPLVKPTNVARFYHTGNSLHKTNTVNDTTTVVSTTGAISRANYSQPFGVVLEPDNRTFVSGLPLSKRELEHNDAASGILVIEKNKFVNDSGNYAHVITRKISGIHVSISDREGDSSGPMTARTERKVFFIDSDRGKTTGLSDWTIFNADGDPVGDAAGTTDTDVTPTGIFGV